MTRAQNLDKNMSTKLHELAKHAQANPHCRYVSLNRYLTLELLYDRVHAVLAKRFARYGLQLHPDKTQRLHFNRNAGNTFDFLGFTHYWGLSRKQRPCIRRKTAKDRLARTARGINSWCKRHRHFPVSVQHEVLCRKVCGHDAYYGITGNMRSLEKLRQIVQRIWIKWLGRRSQKSRFTWEKARHLLRRYSLPMARVVHSYV